MKIIFCDNHLLVVDKPAGISTQPHQADEDNVLDQAKAWLRKQFQKIGPVFLEPIHRLDKPVSGLVLFARTSKALSRLQEMMRQRKIEKTYFAWVEGAMPQEKGTLEHYLFHDEHRARVVDPSHPKAKLARLHYFQRIPQSVKGLEFEPRESSRDSKIGEGTIKDKFLIEIHLETGRYHQIRAQLGHIKRPVIGDLKYGSTMHWKKNAIALRHGRLKFLHPVTKAELCFECNFFLVNHE
jgi:23S rRNA pseudouridine1911/1915/1917 synthase